MDYNRTVIPSGKILMIAVVTMLCFTFSPKAAYMTLGDSVMDNGADMTTERTANPDTTTHFINKILMIGDSMTGWMAERLNAYGDINGFEVATVVWDGSTISKWTQQSQALERIIGEVHPDAIIVSLGMNEMFEQKPDIKLKEPVDNLVESFDSIPYLWIGPPEWPGHQEGVEFNEWMKKELGDNRYFDSFSISLPRQSASNPHPSREGIERWIDRVVEWIPGNSTLSFQSLYKPDAGVISRGKTFIYKRMKENLQ